MTWDISTPPGSEAKSNGDNRIRELKVDIASALTAEGSFPGADTANPKFRWTPPRGDTASRPASPVTGQLYFNTQTTSFERWSGSAWEAMDIVTASTISTSKLAPDSVDSTILKDDASVDGNRAVTTDHIRNSAITTTKIADGAVTSAKLDNAYFSFGDGSDGDLTITSGTTTLNGIKKYNNLTINAGAVLTHDVDRALTLFVKGTLTINGSINVDGKSSNSTGCYCGGGGGGGGGGGSYTTGGGQVAPTAGAGIYASGGSSGVGGGIGSPGSIGLPGSSGGNASIQSYLSDIGFILADKGVKGGNGGDGGLNGSSQKAVGGTGGNGGGLVKIYAKNIVWGGSSLISAKGSSGSTGQNGSAVNTDCGGGGGGGGGCGGSVMIVYVSLTGTPSFDVSGAVGGSGGSAPSGAGAGGSGGQGSSGFYSLVKIA